MRSASRQRRLGGTDQYLRVRRSGRSWAHPLLVLFAARSESGRTRVGITVGRQVGGAVVRNRVRRRVSDAVRRRYEELPLGWDLVFVARAASAESGYGDLSAAVETLLVRAGLLARAS